ncbi:MAG: pantoate--beta-alanine ligase [Planctomycetota bacterium]|jgi:pantoate--beta-alanine ligase
MRILDGIEELRAWRRGLEPGATVGFVPTMGALHDGHLSLVARAREAADVVAVSVFVNPTQFGANEDLDRYPRDREGDAERTGSAGADAIWFAREEEVYPPGFATTVDLPPIARRLCGLDRPVHFPGVALIVLKLFHLFRPTHAFFGEKDYQQCVLVERMVRDLDLEIEIVRCPLVREESGLARSSRNSNLTPEGREVGVALSRGLFRAREAFDRGERDAARLIAAAAVEIEDPRISLEYLELVDPVTLDPLDAVDPERGGRLLVAARLESVRLIDNIALGGEGGGA